MILVFSIYLDLYYIFVLEILNSFVSIFFNMQCDPVHSFKKFSFYIYQFTMLNIFSELGTGSQIKIFI